jgi:hypothetical protein
MLTTIYIPSYSESDTENLAYRGPCTTGIFHVRLLHLHANVLSNIDLLHLREFGDSTTPSLRPRSAKCGC